MIHQLITCEYPPQVGGVSDYSRMVANGLAAAGDEVHVWCPPADVYLNDSAGSSTESPGVFVHRAFGTFTPSDLRRIGESLDRFEAPRRVLVQWVPHGYGYRSMNLQLCLWLWNRAKLKRDRVELMVHEPFLAFGEGSRKQDGAAAIHRAMIVMLLKSAARVWVSIPEWETRLRPFALGQKKEFTWLPVPSNIPLVEDPKGVIAIRSRISVLNGFLLGHFGAYDKYLTEIMLEVLPPLLKSNDRIQVLLVGRGSTELRERLASQELDLAARLHATGLVSATEVSRHISACDAMLQPYQDGVSGRRTSVMTALSHGVPVVTTKGTATEPVWSEGEPVLLTQAGDNPALIAATLSLLDDSRQRDSLARAGEALYRTQFAIEQTISRLRAQAA
ncbi:MAG TPA: glycosyltransferase family 4 protein [Pyrinomonadaceae bacterium]|nr:glycosyltransferase family 4 protein [Pyrinomonadaceae bacterium]